MSKLFAKETDLCAAFIDLVKREKKWTAYPETAGFDIVLVRDADGVQIGIEAKLALNSAVIVQGCEGARGWSRGVRGPDYRAVLVPDDATRSLGPLCGMIGLTVISVRKARWSTRIPFDFYPALPKEDGFERDDWHQWCPVERLKLPEYVPDVAAGASAPLALTHWKIGAIKLAILLEEREITRADFKAFGISPSRWTDPYSGWLERGVSGYRAGPGLPDFKAQHPVNYEQIKADKAKWAPPARPDPAKTGSLL